MRATALRSAALAAAVLLVGIVGWWSSREGPRTDQVATGRTIYEAHCAACHGAQLEGQPDWRTRRPDGRLPAPPHDASGHSWHHSDADLFALTKHGVAPFAPPGYQSDMPAFAGTLSDREIEDVLAYIKSTWPTEIQARQAAIGARSRGR